MSRVGFTPRRWTPTDVLLLLAAMLLALLVLAPGLSIRTLWGPEGRWALIVRDMVDRGSYYLPTANGVVDFDKPLLGYWAALPLAWLRGVNEFTLRFPSVVAAVGLASVVFCLGRRLFGTLHGLLSAVLLLSSTLFVFWSRTASPELLNALAIWVMFLAYVAGAREGRFLYLLVFYSMAAVGAFLKGPVAPAVTVSTIFLFSVWQAVKEIRAGGRVRAGIVKDWFRWIISPAGGIAAMVGIMLFVALLLMPVLLTGSWASVSLMWKENVTRFLAPFDHVDPPYVYTLAITQFFAPWTLFLLAVLWEKRRGTEDTGERWVLLVTLGIFVFFTLSRSRRGYYILPILPALALLTAHGIIQWVRRGRESSKVMTVAAAVTACLMIVAGTALFFLYARSADYRHPSELLFGTLIVVGAVVALICFLKRKGVPGIAILALVVFLLNTWVFTQGMALSEKKRTLVSFAEKVNRQLGGSVTGKVCLYQHGTASLIFYLNSSAPLTECSTRQQCEAFRGKDAPRYMIADLNEVKDQEMVRYLAQLRARAEQADRTGQGERFVLFALHGEDRKAEGAEPSHLK